MSQSSKTLTFANFTGLDLTADLTIDSADPVSYKIPCGGYRDPLTVVVPAPAFDSATLNIQSDNYDSSVSNAYMVSGQVSDISNITNDTNSTALIIIGVNNPKHSGTKFNIPSPFKNVDAGELVYFNCLPSGSLITGRRAVKAMVSSIDATAENAYALGLTASGLSADDIDSRITVLSDIGSTVYNILNGETKLCDVPFADKLVDCNSMWGKISIIFVIVFIVIIVIAVVAIIWVLRKKKKNKSQNQ